MTKRHVITLTKEGHAIVYYSSLKKLCFDNGFNYFSVSRIKGYPKQYKGWTINKNEINGQN